MDNKIISDSEWVPLDGLILEDGALNAIWTNDNVLVIAGPGTGKTELLAQKACYLLQTNKCASPRKILALSVKKDAAANLKERVEKRCGDIGSKRFISITYDAFTKGLLDCFRYSLPIQYRPDAKYSIAKKPDIQVAFQEAGFIKYLGLSDSKLTKIYKAQLKSVQLPIKGIYVKEKAWLTLVKGGKNVESCLTFEMISKLAEYIIRTNEYLKRVLLITYSHVFLDEFQDTTKIQYELIKTCFMNTNTNVTAVGDKKQRIMLWAGALKIVFEDYCLDFQATKSSLLINHRSAPKLVKLQKMMYAILKDDTKGTTCSERWDQDEGTIKLYKFDNDILEAEVIANDILQLVSSGTELKEICILSRQKPEQYTKKLMNKLNALGIRARLEEKYQDLLKEPITSLVLHSLNLSLSEKCPDSWEYIMNYINIAFTEQINFSYDYLLDKQKSLNDLLKSYKNDLIACKDQKSFGQIVKAFLEFYDIDRIKSIYPAYSQGNYYDKTVEDLLRLLWIEHKYSRYDWEKTIDNFKGLNSIPIMTIHKSKGLEYDAVYLIGLEDNAFWGFKKEPMEEYCAFFVALSRAKKSISFTFSKYRSNIRYNKRRVQSYDDINELYELLENSGIVDVIDEISN